MENVIEFDEVSHLNKETSHFIPYRLTPHKCDYWLDLKNIRRPCAAL
jgi:hypothetical protein